MLGETSLPAKTRSVFDYLSQKDRERLQAFRTTRPDAPAPGEPPSSSSTRPRSPSPVPGPQLRAPGDVLIPALHPSIAKAALSGFQPFATDASKHARYTAFLAFRADAANADIDAPASRLGLAPLPGQRADAFAKELADYAEAAAVFKPLSGAMAGRFRSAAVVEAGPTVVEGLRHPVASAEDGDEEGKAEKENKEKEEEDPRMGAVRMGMFGALTREVAPWQPAKLLCKRFGVKEPDVAPAADTAGPSSAAAAAEQTPATPPLAITMVAAGAE